MYSDQNPKCNQNKCVFKVFACDIGCPQITIGKILIFHIPFQQRNFAIIKHFLQDLSNYPVIFNQEQSFDTLISDLPN